MSVGKPSKSAASGPKFPGAIVCQEAFIKGDISIGAGTVVHPKAHIHAEAGPIVIGENNIIEEQVVIHNRIQPVAEGEAPEPKVMVIGSHNVFEVGSHCEALVVGDNNTLEPKCHVSRSTRISNGCVVGARCCLTRDEDLPENTVVFGEESRRRVQGERPAAQTLQMEFLTKILPNYHHLFPH